jgi:hypothetical protein
VIIAKHFITTKDLCIYTIIFLRQEKAFAITAMGVGGSVTPVGGRGWCGL